MPSDELPFLVVFFIFLVSVFEACLPGTLVADRVVAEYVDHIPIDFNWLVSIFWRAEKCRLFIG